MKLTHDIIEQKTGLLALLVVLVVSVGGLVEIVPLYFQRSTTEPVSGLKPYNALRLVGRDVYIREGCYNCHSQMIRPFRAEVERYGHYSVAGEFVYDHPFQWGSKRTGPDLARVGGRYSDDWHRIHGASVRWDGSNRSTSYVSGSELRASIGSNDLAAGKVVQVTVANPGGGVSNALPFSISNPAPALAAISPTKAMAGGADFTLTVTGSNFVANSVVRWNSKDLSTTYVSANELRAAIPSADLGTGGQITVTVKNQAPGGGTSRGETFTVTDFDISASPASLSISAGQSATYQITLNPKHQGPKTAEFEETFARYCKTDHAIAVNNGTAALHATLVSLGIGPGTEVIVPSFTFFATASSVCMAGARPVFADVEYETFNISIESVQELLTPRTRAIIGVDLFGQPFEFNLLREVCGERGIPLIEDAAQAHGAEFHGIKTGNLTTAGCFSFYPTKNMTTGEGGMVTTNDAHFAKKIRIIINHGQPEKYVHTCLGYNFRMTDIGAAIGLVQLRKLDAFNTKRQDTASYFDDNLTRAGIETPVIAPGRTHVYHQYVIRVTDECQ